MGTTVIAGLVVFAFSVALFALVVSADRSTAGAAADSDSLTDEVLQGLLAALGAGLVGGAHYALLRVPHADVYLLMFVGRLLALRYLVRATAAGPRALQLVVFAAYALSEYPAFRASRPSSRSFDDDDADDDEEAFAMDLVDDAKTSL